MKFSLSSLFKSRGGTTSNDGGASHYASTLDFVNKNASELKRIIVASGGSSLSQRLEDVAAMLDCHCLVLCQKLSGQNKFMVAESSNRNVCKRGSIFSWAHNQPIGSADGQAIIEKLPFEKVGGTGFISVPVKNERNILVGLLLGISAVRLVDVDSKTRMLHILSPTFEPEIRCLSLKQEQRQLEQRIISLNQEIEVKTMDLRKEQERSKESKELKSIFLTNLSHEIRTPMNAIMGFIDLLDTVDDESDRRKFLDIIKSNGSTLLAVIDNLVDISKLQSSYMMRAACPVQLNDMLTKIKDKYQLRLNELNKDVIIETSFALETPKDTIWFSDEIIKKVMEQLMDNAVRFTQTGKISISYTMTLKEALFYVADTGPGIKPGKEESIFDMFGGLSLDEDIEDHVGKGIGLAIAKKYISLVGGDINVVSSYRDGACISFSIPIEKL